MEKLYKSILIISFLFSLFYLLLPSPQFPQPPPDSIQSHEPADSETPLRRSYFTNYSRAEVMDWYRAQFKESSLLGIRMPTYTLNYGPEESQFIIRDQTRSTFLEEIVHPLRESIYINGFEPKELKDNIFIEGKNWKQKITVKFVPSSLIIRIIVLIGVFMSLILLRVSFRKAKTAN